MSSLIGLCAIAKNEGRYLAEWIRFHLAIGFDHIAIYDNESTDDTAAVVGQFPGVEYKIWPSVTSFSPQRTAYVDYVANAGASFDWIMFLDLDEFLNLKTTDNVHDFVKLFDADGIAVNWRIFGSSGHQSYSGELVTRRFTQASQEDFGPNVQVKTLFRPGKLASVPEVHSPQMADGAVLVDVRGVRLPGQQANLFVQPVDFSVAQVNHYFTRSEEEFRLKRGRGRADYSPESPDRYRGMEEFGAYDRNEVEDRSIERLAQRVFDAPGTLP